MPLMLQPHPDGSPSDQRAVHGGFEVGSIKKMTVRSSGEKWVWSLNSLLFGAAGVRTSGVAATIEEAKIAIKENWDRWLKWAEPSEEGAAPGGTQGSARVLSVTISKIDAVPPPTGDLPDSSGS